MDMKYGVFALLLGAPVVAGAIQLDANFPSSEPEDSPRVLAFYQAQCERYAEADWLKADQRSGFVAQCMKDMPSAWPVGWDKSPGGDE
jgi:hypothetical protein